MTLFESSFDTVLGNEGGYVFDPRDPGGETHWGISKRAYQSLNIKALTQADAKVIYKRDYWDRAQCDKLPPALAFAVFDAAVNSGIGQAIRWLQRAIGVADDGIVGPLTMVSIQRQNDDMAICARFNGYRLDFMTRLSTWDVFGKGWARRIAQNLQGVGK